jgi:hypothetical protein
LLPDGCMGPGYLLQPLYFHAIGFFNEADTLVFECE